MTDPSQLEREVEDANRERNEVQGPSAQALANAKANKAPAVTDANNLTIDGERATSQQLAEANTLLGVARELDAPGVATEALIYAAIGESRIGHDASDFTPNSEGYYGVLQGSDKTWPNPHDTAGMARSFLLGGKGFQSDGAIALSRTVSDPLEIAVRVEVPSIWPANAYASEDGSDQFLPEARAIIAAYGGGALSGAGAGSSSASGSAGTGSTGSSPFPTKTFTRGTTTNPDEDSWENITQTAKEEEWFAFTDGKSLFYMDGPQLAAQLPVAWIDVPANKVTRLGPDGRKVTKTGLLLTPVTGTVDNTAFLYRKGHKVKGRTQRRSRIGKPSTPSEVKVSILSGITDYRAGGVIVFENSGPLNGGWIIADATRKCLSDPFTKLILQPPVSPTHEAGESVTSSSAGETTQSNGSTAESVPDGSSVPSARWNPDQKPIAAWIIPILRWAAANGWTGTVTSGYRNDIEQESTAANYAARLGKSIAEIYPDGPLASNHCGVNYPKGAIDVTNAEQLNEVLKRYPSKPTLIWAQYTIEDGVHFSSDGH